MTDSSTPSAPAQHAGLSPYDRRRSDPLTVTGEQRIVRRVELAFAPVHKAAFGVATGTVLGGVLGAITLLDLLLDQTHHVPLGLLSQYFVGYSATVTGALLGVVWGFVVGFVAGWFIAFARNAAMAVWVLYFRARADWQRSDDFLDYI